MRQETFKQQAVRVNGLLNATSLTDEDERLAREATFPSQLITRSYYRKGVAYVMENLDEDDKAVIRAKCNKSYSQHLVPNGSIVDDSPIIDLLEEYGQNEGLPEGWYLDEYDASVILAMI